MWVSRARERSRLGKSAGERNYPATLGELHHNPREELGSPPPWPVWGKKWPAVGAIASFTDLDPLQAFRLVNEPSDSPDQQETPNRSGIITTLPSSRTCSPWLQESQTQRGAYIRNAFGETLSEAFSGTSCRISGLKFESVPTASKAQPKM